MKNNRGKFIVIEGLDGCGGETQSNLLIDFFLKNNIACQKISYPDYEGPIGQLIDKFLHNQYDFSPNAQVLLYFADFLKDKENIEKWLKEGKIVVADRYLTSTLAYQGLKNVSVDSVLNLAGMFNLPKPDLILYLKISAAISADRKYKEKGNLDRHEADNKFLENLSKFYLDLIDKKIFSDWQVIDGEKGITEVFDEIKSILSSKLNINQNNG
jgi:dTMP kinase